MMRDEENVGLLDDSNPRSKKARGHATDDAGFITSFRRWTARRDKVKAAVASNEPTSARARACNMYAKALPFKMRVALIVWVLVVAVVTMAGYVGMGHAGSSYSINQVLNFGLSRAAPGTFNRLCYWPGNISESCGAFNETDSIALNVSLLDEASNSCVKKSVMACQALADTFFSTTDECSWQCAVPLAPVGAYLMLTGLVMAVGLVLMFVVCLPLDSDKKRLQRRLLLWLAVNLILILLVAAVSFSGAIILATNEHAKLSYADWNVTLLWKAVMVASPLLVLSFHLYFWRNVFRSYNSIDTSKEVIRGVWSSKF